MLAALLLAVVVQSPSHAPHERVAIAHAKALVPVDAPGSGETAERWLDDATIVIEDGRVARVASGEAAPASSTVLDARGAFAIPGLVDLHSHLLLHPYDETSWDDQVAKESLELRTIRAVASARATLEAGFTTLRELGTEGAAYADVALKRAIAQEIVPGPRLFVATRAIVATHCYGPVLGGLGAIDDAPIGAQEATGVDEVRRAVREQIHHGADWIKVYADYRRAEGAPATPTFSAEELEALVDEARSARKPVAAHASTDEGIARAVRAGVATIEHGYGASDATLALMREKHVVLCPTLSAVDATARYAGWNGADPAPEGVARARATFRRALAAGVTIACGSDVGVFAHGTNARELELMVALGMTPAAALRSATRTAATVLGEEHRIGSIEPGAFADVVLLAQDPLANTSALRTPLVVLKAGKVVVDRR